MRYLLALVVLAGAALAVVALRAPTRDYVAPTEADVAAHQPAPQSLHGEVPADCVVRRIDVKGMCCLGCTGRLYDRIRNEPGIVEAAVSFEQGVAEVVIRKDADPEPIVAALHFDKYEPALEPETVKRP